LPSLLNITGNLQIPEGEPGKLSVVIVGEVLSSPYSASLPVVVRNRTADALYNVEATAIARGLDGLLAGSGRTQGFTSTRIGPGEWAFASVYFSSEMPDGATFEVTVTGEKSSAFLGSVDVRPVELNQTLGSFSDIQIVGIVANETEKPVDGPISVSVACFDDSGSVIIGVFQTYTDGDAIPPGGRASFAADIYDVPCPNFAVGASGYNF
jgi:hypothetical protein